MSTKTNLKLELAEFKFAGKNTEVSELYTKGAAVNIHQQVLDGKLSASRVAEAFTAFSKIYEELKATTDEEGKNKFSDLVREDIMRNSENGKNFTTKHGTRLELFESSGKTDYSVCNHPYYNFLLEEELRIKEEKKTIEAYLKTLKAPTIAPVIQNPVTGEQYENCEIFPPKSEKTPSYKVVLLKD